MTDLVIYYSRTGNTRTVAQIIAEQKNAQLLEIKDRKNRSGPIRYLQGAFDAMRNKTTNIEYKAVNLMDYDTVYIGTPVWASNPTPAINEFVEQNDFTGVNTVVFATMMSSGGDATTRNLSGDITNKGGNIIRSFSLAIKKDTDIKKLTLEALNDE